MRKKLLEIFACVMMISTPSFAQKLTSEDVMKKVSSGKPYTFVMLKNGKALPKDKPMAEKMQMDHLVNLFQMEQDGKISIFGPITSSKELEGIIIFNSADTNEVKKELFSDPYIKSGYMKFDMYSWFSIPGQKLP